MYIYIYLYYPSIKYPSIKHIIWREKDRERESEENREREREIKLMYTSYTSIYCFPVICCYKTCSIWPRHETVWAITCHDEAWART